MNVTLFNDKAGDAAQLLSAMANQKRLMILCLLTQGELTVGEIGEQIGLRQSPLSQHLAKLRERHLVSTRRSGQSIYYSLAATEVTEVLNTLYDLYCQPEQKAKAS